MLIHQYQYQYQYQHQCTNCYSRIIIKITGVPGIEGKFHFAHSILHRNSTLIQSHRYTGLRFFWKINLGLKKQKKIMNIRHKYVYSKIREIWVAWHYFWNITGQTRGNFLSIMFFFLTVVNYKYPSKIPLVRLFRLSTISLTINADY